MKETNVTMLCPPTKDRLQTDPLEHQIVPNPLPLVLTCPECSFPHIDNDYWRKRLHRTHLCASCRHTWRPSIFNTVGVEKVL